MVLFNNHNAMRLGDGIKNCPLIERFNRAEIDNLGGNIFFFELSRNLQRDRNSLSVTDDGDVAAFPFHLRFAQRDKQFFIGRLDDSL